MSTARARGTLVSLAKFAITIAALALVARKVDLGETWACLRAITGINLFFLAVLTTAQVALSAIRWYRLLRALGEEPRFSSVFGDVVVGLLYNLILPTSIGGDVVRALRARRRASVPHHAWSSSIYERLAGLVAMAIMAFVGMGLGASFLSALPRSLTIATVIVGVVVVGAFGMASAPFGVLVRVLGTRVPAAARADLIGITDDLAGPLSSAKVRAEALFWSLTYQGVAMLFVIVAARALGVFGKEAQLFLGMPMIYILSMVPISLGGHGLREGLYVGILGMLGFPKTQALGLATLWLVSSVVFAIAGAGVALTGPKVPTPEAS